MPLKNQIGFGLIEMLIAVAVLGVIAVGFANLTSFQVGSQKNIHATSELESTVLELKQALASSAICKANMQGLTFDRSLINAEATYPDTDIPNITLPSAPTAPLLVNNTALKNLPGSIIKISLTGVKELTPGSLYLASIKLSLVKDGTNPKSVAGPNRIFRMLPISVRTSAAGNIQTIVDCSSGTFDSAPIAPSDIGKWVPTGTLSTDASIADCSAALTYAVSNSSTAQSVSGFCAPVGGQCKIPWPTTPASYLVETCKPSFTDATPPGGGGGGEGGNDSSE